MIYTQINIVEFFFSLNWAPNILRTYYIASLPILASFNFFMSVSLYIYLSTKEDKSITN